MTSFRRQPDGSLALVGCVGNPTSQPAAGCAAGRAIDQGRGLAVSPDGRNVYVANSGSDAVAVFDRDPTTGALTQKAGAAGCIAKEAREGCGVGRGLDGPEAIFLSPDGRNVYVAGGASDAVAVFDRDPATGALTQKAGTAGCIASAGAEGCGVGRGLSGGPRDIAGTATSLYVPSGSTVAILDRDPATGALTQKAGAAGCLDEGFSPEGCASAREIFDASDVAVAPDGSTVYFNVLEGVDVFDRDPATGALTQKPGGAGCLASDRLRAIPPGCVKARGLFRLSVLASSPDGRSLYVLGSDDILMTFDVAQPSAPSAPATAAAADRAKPSVSGFKITPPKFRVAAKLRAAFAFTLSEKAGVKIEIARAQPGRLVGGKCGKPSRGKASSKPCKRFVGVGVTDLGAAGAGASKVPFDGRVGKRRLKPGAYRATIVATDAAGNRSAPQSARFTVLKPVRPRER